MINEDSSNVTALLAYGASLAMVLICGGCRARSRTRHGEAGEKFLEEVSVGGP